MIWFWIIASLILSFLPLINKKINIANYVWLLIPIDAYGLSIAGAVIKPYMIFCIILLFVVYIKAKGTDFDLSASKGQLFAGVIVTLILIVSLFNSPSLSAIKAAFLALVVYLCAQIYASCADFNSAEQISDVFIASCFGCSVIFLVAYVCLVSGLQIDGIVAPDRTQVGMYMTMKNMSNGQYFEVYRLRGFAFDPTTMFPHFIFGITACVSRIFKKFNLYYIITLIFSILCIILSSSRMGILCCAISIVITAIVCIVQFESVKKQVLSITGGLALCVALLGFAVTKYGQAMLTSLLSIYSNRSSLTDEYGRFSIWKECISGYWEESPLWGVGLGQIQNFTAIERTAHNTWLQFICECGIIVGGIAIVYFLSIMVIGWVKTKAVHNAFPQNTSYFCVVIGYTMTVVSLFSADNITCSYLWFCAMLILKLAFSCESNNYSSLKHT